jgi:hypothetical protein
VVFSGLVPPQLCSARLDLFPEGRANYENARPSRGLHPHPLPYRNSFLGPGDFGDSREVFEKIYLPEPTAGWLVDVSTCQPDPLVGYKFLGLLRGRYRRLMLDGSVATRQHPGHDNTFALGLLFCDNPTAMDRALK